MTQQELETHLTAPSFRAWLTGQDPDEVVGCSGVAGEDPIARFLADMLGWEGVSVGDFGDQEHLYVGDVVLDLPAWAVKYVERADERWDEMDVSAREVLDVLDELEDGPPTPELAIGEQKSWWTIECWDGSQTTILKLETAQQQATHAADLKRRGVQLLGFYRLTRERLPTPE